MYPHWKTIKAESDFCPFVLNIPLDTGFQKKVIKIDF